MLRAIQLIAGRELLDGWRDRRGLLSSAVYSMMGPAVVWMVSLAVKNGERVLIPMMSVFTLVAAFSGGMNVAMDAIAGERERRSLVPLLLHPVTRLELLIGKALAVGGFAAAGLALNLLGSVLLFRRMPAPALALTLIPLCLLAAAAEIWISTFSRGIKEAQSYLSMAVFLPMGLGMFMVFSPSAQHGWWKFVPLAGHQLQLEAALGGRPLDFTALAVLAVWTAILACVALFAAAGCLELDDVVYGS